MTSLIAAIGEGSSVTADVLSVQRAFVFQQPLFLGRAFISKKDHVHSLFSPSHLPTIPAFNVAPENVFILSLNEDDSKQLGNK